VKKAASFKNLPLKSRRLVTIGPDAAVWKEPEDADSPEWMKGAIVRLQPPADASDQLVSAMEKILYGAGAAVVRIDQRAQEDVEPVADAPTEPEVNLREAATRAAASEPQGVRDVVEEALSRAKL